MKYITIEQAVAAVRSFLDRSKGQQVYPSAPYWVERIVDAIRALPPAEPTEEADRDWHDWRLVGTTDAAPGEATARYRCNDCHATVDLPPTVRGSVFALASWLDKQAGLCRTQPQEPSEEEVERVARAILPVVQEHIVGSLTSQGVPTQNTATFDSMPAEDREAMLRAARAAIAAMREGRPCG